MSLYTYKAKVLSVYDGDTIRATFDLGFGIELKNQSIRLSGINAPEVRGESRENGLKSRDRLRELVLDKEVIITTKKDKKGKYGRWLGEVFVDGESANYTLLAEGYAQPY